MTVDMSPLNADERAELERVARVLAENPSGLDGYGGWAFAFLRLLAERDSLAVRVRELENRGDNPLLPLRSSLLDQITKTRERTQEVRRAWDRFVSKADRGGVCLSVECEEPGCQFFETRVAIDSLIPPAGGSSHPPAGGGTASGVT